MLSQGAIVCLVAPGVWLVAQEAGNCSSQLVMSAAVAAAAAAAVAFLLCPCSRHDAAGLRTRGYDARGE
jgi:hypothetical protein